MAQAMLGKLPLSAVRGPRDTLEEHLAGPDGPQWLEWLKCLNRKENPFSEPFPRNHHGHYVVTFVAPPKLRTGTEEATMLKEGRFLFGEPAVDACLRRPRWHHNASYNQAHRLMPGKSYSVALVPVGSLCSWERNLDNLQGEVAEKFGYTKPVAGLVPALVRFISVDVMRQMRMRYIAAAHKPIGEGSERLLIEVKESGFLLPYLRAVVTDPGASWSQDGAFAYMIDSQLVELD